MTITWDSAGSGEVEISISTEENDVFFAKVPNSGSYTITAAQLSGLTAGSYILTLDYYRRSPITAFGYDSGSFIRARVQNFCVITFQL